MSLEVEILIDGQAKKVGIESPRGRHQKRYIEVWSKIASSKEVDPEIVKEFMDMRDSILMELTGMKEEEVEDLELTEKEKIMTVIEDLILMRRRADFLPSSQKPQSQ